MMVSDPCSISNRFVKFSLTSLLRFYHHPNSYIYTDTDALQLKTRGKTLLSSDQRNGDGLSSVQLKGTNRIKVGNTSI